MSEEKVGLALTSGEEGEARARLWERNFVIDIDDIELEFVGQTPRLIGNIEINFEALEGDSSPFLLNI